MTENRDPRLNHAFGRHSGLAEDGTGGSPDGSAVGTGFDIVPLIDPTTELWTRAVRLADARPESHPVSHIAAAPSDPAPDDASDMTVNGPAARATYHVDGTGEKIGIISDSFNSLGGYAYDQSQGYLPVVQVLGDQQGSDEGRAMAELVHETAPGASLAFDDAGGSTASFAAAVTALQNAGCKIIVDDITFPSGEPFFQLGSNIDTAIENFVAAGGDYFSAAGNDGNDYYQSSFTPIATTLPGLGQITAESFGATEAGISGNSALQSLTIAPGTSIDLALEWNQPFPGIGGSAGAVNNLGVYLYQDGSIVASAATPQPDGTPAQELTFTNPANASSSSFDLAVVWNSGTVQPGTFRYFLNDALGTINDPAASQGQGDLYGHELLPNINVVGAASVTTAPPQASGPPAIESYSEYGPGELLFDTSGNALAAPQTASGISFVAPDGANTTNGFAPFNGTSAAAPVAAAVAALVLQKDPNLTSAQVTSILKTSAIPLTTSGPNTGAGFIQANTALADTLTPCFVRGTRILTARGDIEVEALRVGDHAITQSGRPRPIRWVGRRVIDLTRHPDPETVQPVRILAGAFADLFAGGAPRRDLIVSPDHALFVDGALVMARLLVNGVTILTESRSAVEYFHVELDGHDVLLAESLPAESYLDTGNRGGFDNADVPMLPRPALAASPHAARRAGACAPFLVNADEVRPIWHRLAARAAGTTRAVAA